MKRSWLSILITLCLLTMVYVGKAAAQPPPKQKPKAVEPQVDLGPEVPLPYSTDFADADALKIWKVHDERDAYKQPMPSKWEVTDGHTLTQRLWGNLTLPRTDSHDTFAHTYITVGSRNWKDYEAEVTVRRPYVMNDYTTFGVLVGYQGPEKQYRFTVDNRYGGQGPTMRLERREKDRVIPLAIYRAGIPHDVSVKVRVAFAHGRLAVWVADIPIINVAEQAIPTGKAGLFTAMPGGRAGEPSIVFSQFSVKPVTDPAAVAPTPTNVLSAVADASAIIYSAMEDQLGPFALIDERVLLPEKNAAGEFNHPWGPYDWDANQENLPFEIVFRFPRREWAQLENITFVKKSFSGNPFVRDVEVSVSRTSPLEGFVKMGKFTLGPGEGEETFPLGGIWARYLKVEFLSAQSAGNKITLGEVRAQGTLSATGPAEIAAAASDRFDLQESEPNNTVQTANALPLGKVLAGALSTEADKDVFRVTLPPGAGDTLHLTFNTLTPGAPEMVITNSRGEVIDKIGAATLYLRPTELSWKLPPGEYFITLAWPPASLVMLYDDSDSMMYSLDETRKAWQQLLTTIDRLTSKVAIMLLRYNEQPESLTGFLTDSTALRAVLSKNIGRGGSTQTQLGINAALNALRDRPGNHVILWLMDGFDYKEQGERHFQKFFRRIRTEGVHVYILGVGHYWADHEQFMGITQGARATELSAVSGGEFYIVPSDDKIGAILDRIVRDLTSSIRYNLRADWVKGKPVITGELRVNLAPEVEALSRNLEIVLDASGSMNAKLGDSTRFGVAKKVLADLVSGLSPDTNVALRVFGHRKGGPESCEDTELLVPLARVVPQEIIVRVNAAGLPGLIGVNLVAPQEIIAKVNALRAKGETPLVANLRLAAGDLASAKAGTIVAITDGEESCGGDLKNVAAEIKAQGVEAVVNIVGFNLPTAKAIADWKQVAQSSGGRFFDAKTASELGAAVSQAARMEYVAVAPGGRVVGKAQVGTALQLPEGTYTLVVRAGEPVQMEGVQVSAGKPVAFTLRRGDTGWILEQEKTKP